MNKINDQELEKLRELNSGFVKFRGELADLEIKSRTIQLRKDVVFQEMDRLSTDFKSIEAELLEKYGNKTINLTTGEIKDDEN